MVDHWQMALKVKENPHHCPHCDSALILKEGRNGKFLACPRFPECQYTKSLSQYREFVGRPYCEKCKGEGKLPLRRKSDNTIVPNAWVYCECYEEPEHYPPIRPQDFDFPMSYDFYRFLCYQHGWPDPGNDMPRPPEDDKPRGDGMLRPPEDDKPGIVEHIHRHSDMGKKEFVLLQQTARKVDYLEKVIKESEKKKKAKQKAEKKTGTVET